MGPEVVVLVVNPVSVISEVVAVIGLVDTNGGERVVLAVGSDINIPEDVVVVTVDPVAVVLVAFVVIGLDVSDITVVL